MALEGSTQVEHGVAPFGYVVEASIPQPGSLDGGEAWQPRHVKLEQVETGYGAGPFYARYKTWDADALDESLDRSQLVVPTNGETVRVRLNVDGVDRVIFKGVVVGVNIQYTDSGKTYRVDAMSDGGRLDETHVTLSANVNSDPMNPAPQFSDEGTLVEHRLLNVAELVERVMEFRDAWGQRGRYRYSDIDWQGFENDPRCGGFVPSQVSFVDKPRGRAIEEILQRAGNFYFVYDPASDKFRVVERTLRCDTCGPQWDARFARPDEDEDVYAYDYNVMGDETEWSTRSTVNTLRVTGPPIEFYSGHGFVPDRVDPNGTAASNVADRDNDPAALQDLRSRNLDGAYYRWSFTKGKDYESLPDRHSIVGTPLFPGWNIHADFLPDLLEILEVQLPDNPPRPADFYEGKFEFRSRCLGDMSARGATGLSRRDPLRVYEMWHAPDLCPACGGSGLVDAVYDNAENEPEITLVPVDESDPEGPQMVSVTNYIMDPKDFGARDDSGERLPPPEGLRPWSGGDNQYPLPWKNTCPYCRGTGHNPEHKIRDVQDELFRGAVNGLRDELNAVVSLPTNPDRVRTGPESWQEAQTRANRVERAQVQLEFGLAGEEPLPQPEHKQKDYREIARLGDASRRYPFPHPLQYELETNRLQLALALGISPGSAAAKIVPDTWNVRVPFTTINTGFGMEPFSIDRTLGRVVFQGPVFIPAFKEYRVFNQVRKGVYRVNTDGTLLNRSPGNGMYMADRSGQWTGFWRPARVWSTFYYHRKGWYHAFEDERDVRFTNPEGQLETYRVRAMVVDGRYCLEVRKKSTDPTEEFTAGSRVIQKAIQDRDARLQIGVQDLLADPLPPGVNPGDGRENQIVPDLVDNGHDTTVAQEIYERMTPAEVDDYGYYLYKRDEAQYRYPQGHLLKWEQQSAGEVAVRMENRSLDNDLANFARPRRQNWQHKDARPRMLARAIRELEADNQLQVSGSITMVNVFADLSTGLGWVDYPDRARASVDRVTFDFGNGFDVNLELTRSEARYGELPPDGDARLIELEKRLDRAEAELQRSAADDVVSGGDLDDESLEGGGVLGVA